MDIIITTHNTTHKKELQDFYSKYNPKIILVDDTKTDMDLIMRITQNIKMHCLKIVKNTTLFY